MTDPTIDEPAGAPTWESRPLPIWARAGDFRGICGIDRYHLLAMARRGGIAVRKFGAGGNCCVLFKVADVLLAIDGWPNPVALGEGAGE